MIINKLHIDGFGVFKDKSLSNLKPGINLLYGKNEAGKSTLLDFIRFTLFDYPRSVAERRPPLNGGDHGGTIYMTDDLQVQSSIYRNGSSKKMEFVQNGEKFTDDEAFKRLTNQASASLYRNVYAITIDELTSISDLDDSGMKDRIFSIGMGLGNLNYGAFEKSLSETSEQYFTKRGNKQILSMQMKKIQELQSKINALTLKKAEYERFAIEYETANEEFEEIIKQRAIVNNQLQKVQNLNKAYFDYVEYLSAANTIKEIGNIQLFPNDLLDDFRVKNDQSEEILGKIQRLEEQLKELNNEVLKIHVNQKLLEQYSQVDYLKRNSKSFEDNLKLVSNQQDAIYLARKDLDEILQKIGDKTSLETLLNLSNVLNLRTSASEISEQENNYNRKLESEQSNLDEMNNQIEIDLTTLKDLQQKLAQASINNLEGRAKAIERKVGLESEFQKMISNIQPMATSSNSKYARVFGIIMMVIGVVLFSQDYVYGGIITTASVAYLILTFLTKKQTIKLAQTKNPNEINLALNQLVTQLKEFDDLQQKIEDVQKQKEIKTQRKEQIQQKLEELSSLKLKLEVNWNNILINNNLNDYIRPSNMGDFLSFVDKLQQINRKIQDSQESIEKAERELKIFEDQCKKILTDDRVIDTLVIQELIVELEENQRKAVEYEQKHHVIQQLGEQIKAEQEYLNTLQLEIQNIFTSTKTSNNSELINRFEMQEKYQKAQEKLSISRDNIKKFCGVNNFEDSLKELASFNSTEEITANITRLEDDFQQIDNEHNRKLEVIASLRTKQENLLKPDEMFSLQNKLENAKEQLIEDAKEWFSLKLASKVLIQTRQKFEKEKQPEVIRQTSEYFKKITENRYENIQISLSDGNVNLIQRNGNSKEIGELSRGAKEQLLLSLRLGLIQEYEKNAEPLPMVFDDIMVNFDHDRQKTLVKILTEFAKNRQLLFFTCHESVKELFEESHANIIDWKE